MDSIEKNDITMLSVKAYTLPSSSYVPDDSHCFVANDDGASCWRNYGRGWEAVQDATLISSGKAYMEWLLEFIPPDNLPRCGLTFAYNGVCHTYANRELLLCEEPTDVWTAAKDYVCVAIFGVYGYGLDDLKTRLITAYKKVSEIYTFPPDALNAVLCRIDNTLDRELQAWMQTATDYFGIPVDELIAKDPIGGKAIAKYRLEHLREKRESLYLKSKEDNLPDYKFRKLLIDLMLSEIDSYLSYMVKIEYIENEDMETYHEQTKKFLEGFADALATQAENYHRTGHISMNHVSDFLSNNITHIE